jgi:hypothetical protein
MTKIKQDYTNFVIDIYSGVQPLDSNDAPNGVLLARVTLNGDPFVEGFGTNGLNFDTPVDGVLTKDPAEVWKYVGVAEGTARWFRARPNIVDDESQSLTLERFDGSVGTVTGDMIVSNLAIQIGTPGTVDVFNVTKRPST